MQTLRCYNITPSIPSSHEPTCSPQHQPTQHFPQSFCTLFPTIAQSLFNAFYKIFRLPPQLINDSLRVLKAALALHILQRIALDLLIRCLLLQYIDQDLVARVGAYRVDDGEREFSFRQVFAQAFEGGVAGRGGEVEVVVKDLEEETDCGYEGCAVAVLALVF